MGNSSLPTVLDKLCMVANINTRKLIDVLRNQIEDRNLKIYALQDRLKQLQKDIDPRRGLD